MKVLIIEDELHSANRLKKMVLDYDPEIVILGILDSVEQSIEWFKKHKEPDLIFLDIQLSDGESFSIFKEIQVEAPVIFITAYNEYAIDAFRLNSVDYLLKPVEKDKLALAMKKYSRLHRFHSPDYRKISIRQEDNKKFLNRMMIRIGATIRTLEVDQIAYFYISDRTTYAMMKNGHTYPIDHSLEKLELELDPKYFFRLNRQFIISYHSINKMVVWSKSRIKVILEPPSEIESVSSSDRTPQFRNWLDGQQN